MDFNHQRFFAWCYRMIKSRELAKTGKRQKLDELAICRALIIQDSPLSPQRFDNRTGSIGVQLCSWVDAEIALLKEIMPDSDGAGYENPFKLLHKLNVLSTAFWYKLQNDHGVLDEKIEDLALKVAHNCATKQQADLSEGSVRTKFYTKDHKVLKTIEDILSAMLEDVRKMLA